jgi:diguanylate cyclase (GGDEF)-like protein
LLRLHIAACVVAALAAPVVLTDASPRALPSGIWPTMALLVALSVVNLEWGRLLEGGVARSHRPHKALSAWAFAAALLLPTWCLVPVVVLTYGHARWRGLRLPLWKWIGSGAYVTLSALAAALSMRRLEAGMDADWAAGGGAGLLLVAAAGAVFLGVQTLLFHGSAYLNEADDEVWLRNTLRSRGFYLTEAGTLVVGAVSAAVWIAQSWLVLLMIPVYGLTQRAALHEPLLERANTDAKTGLLRYEAWRRLAVLECDRCTDKQAPWSIVFADLDHFKAYNDTWGHLAGDEALTAVANVLKSHVRSSDLVGRFGGEELCIMLPDTTPAAAVEVAERVRASVAALRLPRSEAGITISLGVAGADPGSECLQFADVLLRADRALLAAKNLGRNSVRADGLVLEAHRAPAIPAQLRTPDRSRLSAADGADLARPDR